MRNQHLVLPEYTSILDLTSDSKKVFSELGLVEVQSQTNMFTKRELYELPQKGVFQYTQSLIGNNMLNIFILNDEKGNEIEREYHNLCGLLQILGFDENQHEFRKMLDVVRNYMSKYFFEGPYNK